MDMKGVTREEAVLFLLSLQDQIDLIVQYRKDEYEQIVASQRGDSFHIKWVHSLRDCLIRICTWWETLWFAFLDFVHHPVFWAEHSISETGFISIPTLTSVDRNEFTSQFVFWWGILFHLITELTLTMTSQIRVRWVSGKVTCSTWWTHFTTVW